MSLVICESCEKEMTRTKVQDFDYTALAGLNPAEHEVFLREITGYECECGFAPEIPNVTGLHITIGISLIRDERPLDGDAVRFLRKTLALTQVQFAGLFELSPQHYSLWETGQKLPPKSTRLAAAVAFLGECLDEENAQHVDREYLVDTLKCMIAKTHVAKKAGRARLDFDPTSTPPAWMIHDFSAGRSDMDFAH